MKNTQIYPFERNRYFYGKLLSVEDFNAEQKYMNDKRRLINRLVHGVGVVCGLNVVRVDDNKISVESGLALDPTGREIVVESSETKLLSSISGYDTSVKDGTPYVYLCIEYSEKDKGSAHNIAAEGGGKSSSDRIRESYNLFLTSKDPADDINTVNELYESTVTVFRDSNLRIRHIMPKYVNPDSVFEFKVEIENFSKQFAAFSYDIQLVCLNLEEDGSSVINVKFDETIPEKTGKYTLSYQLRAGNVSDTDGTASVDPETFSLSYNKIAAVGSAAGKSSAAITGRSIAEAVTDGSYGKNLDTEMRTSAGRRIYLARIDLVNAGGSAIIYKVKPVPFGQYVAGSSLLSARLAEMGLHSSGVQAPVTVQNAIPAAAMINDRSRMISSGVCRVNLNAGSYKNKVIMSEEIIHGLGLGSVTIILGTPMKEGGVVYGSSDIFETGGAVFETAAKLDPTRGSFVIGIRAKTAIVADYLDIKWTAIRDVDENVTERSSMRILIKPNSLIIKPRDSKYLEAVCSNMTNKTVRWSVSPENGGEIDSNGLYTAPNIEGVYEIIAQSAAYPEIKASVMVVVRD